MKDNSCYRIKEIDQKIYFGSDAGFFNIINEEVKYLDINKLFETSYTIDLCHLGSDTMIYTVWSDGTYFTKGNKIIKKIPQYGNELYHTKTKIILKTQSEILIISRKSLNIIKKISLIRQDKNLQLEYNLNEIAFINKFDSGYSILNHYDFSIQVDPNDDQLHIYNFLNLEHYFIYDLRELKEINHPLKNRSVNSLIIQKDGYLFIRNNEIVEFNKRFQFIKIYKPFKGENKHFIQTILSKNGYFILGTSPHPRSLTFNQLFIFNPQSKQTTPITLNNNDFNFRHMLLNTNNHLCLSSVKNGVSIIKNIFIEHHQLNHQLKGAFEIQSFNNEVYFSNEFYFGKIKSNNGKYQIVKLNKGPYRYIANLNDSIIFSFPFTSFENIPYYEIPGFIQNRYFYIQTSRQEKKYLTGIKQFNIFERKNKKLIPVNSNKSNHNKRYFYYTTVDSTSYLLNKNNILSIDWRNNAFQKSLKISTDNLIYNSIEGFNKKVFISTNKGLYSINKNWSNFSIQKHAINNYIDESDIQKTYHINNNILVVCTTEELFISYYNNSHYFKLNNLNIYSTPEIIILNHNDLEIYGTFGLVKIPLNILQKNSPSTIYKEPINIDYSYNENIHFCIYPVQPIKEHPFKYRYRLNETQNWSYSYDHEFKLDLLAQEDYQIQVDFFNQDKIWETVLLKEVNTTKPWYLNLYIIFGISLGGLLIGGLFARKKIQQIAADKRLLENTLKEKSELNEKLENIRMQLASDFHDNLGNDLASIIVNTEVIQDETLSKERFQELNMRINKNAKNIFNGAKDFIWTLQLNHNNSTEIFQLVSDFGNEFFELSPIQFYAENSIKTPINLPQEHVQDLILILKELITNAYKHSNGDEVYFMLSSFDHFLVFTVMDNGKGLTEYENKQSNGLKNMHSRGLKINAELKYLRIQNKTKFQLTYPLHHEN